jgi:hypothetical protein
MADPFENWVPFFEYLASTAAALLGLAFVAIQLNHKDWQNHSLYPSEARTALSELAAPLFFALIVLMPDHQWGTAAISVSVFGFSMIAWHAWVFLRRRKFILSSEPTSYRFHVIQFWLLGVLVAEYIALLTLPNDWKAYGVLWMVFSGLTETWWMLFRSNTAQKDHRDIEASAIPDTQWGP